MFRKMLVSLVLVLLATLPVMPKPQIVDSQGEMILLRRCQAEYRHATQLGAPTAGVLQDCRVELGDKVKAGQVLGRLRDMEQRAEMERAKFEAESLASVQSAESRYTLARTKNRYARDLFRRNAVGKQEYEIAQQEEETARLALEEAKVSHRLAELRYRLAEAAVRTREIVSPHDGIVVQIIKHPGEGASALPHDPVFRVVNPELLRVTGYLDEGDAWRVRSGQSVQVTAETDGPVLPIHSEVFQGRVIFVDSEIDTQTSTCKVVAEVKNRKGLLRAGLQLKMEVLVGTGVPDGPAGR